MSSTHGKQRLQFKPIVTANTVLAILALVKEGLGIALLPQLFIENNLEYINLVQVLPSFELSETGVYAVHAFSDLPPLSVRTMIEVMKRNI